ncbi:MAG: hypothetical protein ACRCZJ_05210 [Erysipelotrichaceae bacterium]
MKNQTMKLEGFGKKPTFASFLPGISGKEGIPLWCFYVNRGQCVTSFGVEDKDHSIMEFYPAHQAYQNVKQKGFRTFIKVNGEVFEPFLDEAQPHHMEIHGNSLSIAHTQLDQEINTKVSYFILPDSTMGALVRKVEISNLSKEAKAIEVLDGMPELIPYGVGLESMKEMGQTVKAWMQVEHVEEKTPFYRVRVSMNDSATVSEVTGGHFALGYDQVGTRLGVIADPKAIFGYDTSLTTPIKFQEQSLASLLSSHQNTKNELPCAFFGLESTLEPQTSVVYYELFGQVEHKPLFTDFINQSRTSLWFETKAQRAEAITDTLCDVIQTKTGNVLFDGYIRQTYLDNVLRGGVPTMLGEDTIFYLYSRKHGDIERDYNFFKMLPEFYSQGNGNFRDVNQNRRNDICFTPQIGDANIKMFYSLLQIDGYNPLVIDKITYQVAKEHVEKVVSMLSGVDTERMTCFLQKPWTPGALAKELQTHPIVIEDMSTVLANVVGFAQHEFQATFGEGYWSDHWTYNLDLIERYLGIYPENTKALLVDDCSYAWYGTRATVLPHQKRYVETERGLRQYHFIEEKEAFDPWLCDVSGNRVTSSLLEKLVVLCLVKYATLDAYGMGIEFEGGKPGWYDALNGLPGVFGSSMAETCELARCLQFVRDQVKTHQADVAVLEEVASLLRNIQTPSRLFAEEEWSVDAGYHHWIQLQGAKEHYRDVTNTHVSGNKTMIPSTVVLETLETMLAVVERGIKQAIVLGDGILPTYFSYEVLAYEHTNDGISPRKFKQHTLPYFLEGPVHWLKLDCPLEEKQTLVEKVQQSGLYDKKLKMYKVNASLKEESFELGRAKAFTPGWLENESIWLHMEYKYLLELLKSGMSERFIQAFHDAAVPFLDSEVYGRSVLENVSFIASSANPNAEIHGRGFVARLSGSTAEFLEIWYRMMFGGQVFSLQNDELCFQLQPTIPSYLVEKEATIDTTLLGKINVSYVLNGVTQLIPGVYEIKEYHLRNASEEQIVIGNCIVGEQAKQIREGFWNEIQVMVETK